MTPMQQQLLNGLKKENDELKEKLTHAEVDNDILLDKLKTSADTILKLEDDFERVDDAAEYWKQEFEQFYNAIHRIASLPSEEFTDGDCLDRVMDRLKQYGGQTDEQHEVTW